MSSIKQGLYYSEDHEWLRAEGGFAYIGITYYAQHSLGDLVFADAEPEGSEVSKGETVGVVESVKAASDVNAPVSCKIVRVNTGVLDSPELINSEPYESWLVKVKLTDPPELDSLMDAGEYKTFLDGVE